LIEVRDDVPPFDRQLGWCFVAMAALFSLGIWPVLKTKVYPQAPGLGARMAVPAMFLILAQACFAGFGLWFMIFVILAGARLIYFRRLA